MKKILIMYIIFDFFEVSFFYKLLNLMFCLQIFRKFRRLPSIIIFFFIYRDVSRDAIQRRVRSRLTFAACSDISFSFPTFYALL